MRLAAMKLSVPTKFVVREQAGERQWPKANSVKATDMKADKIRGLDSAEIERQLQDAQEQLFRLRFQMGMGQLEGLKKYRILKKDRARMLTRHERKAGGRRNSRSAAGCRCNHQGQEKVRTFTMAAADNSEQRRPGRRTARLRAPAGRPSPSRSDTRTRRSAKWFRPRWPRPSWSK